MFQIVQSVDFSKDESKRDSTLVLLNDQIVHLAHTATNGDDGTVALPVVLGYDAHDEPIYLHGPKGGVQAFTVKGKVRVYQLAATPSDPPTTEPATSAVKSDEANPQ